MILDWDKKITDVCEQLEIDPEKYNEDDKLKEWMARHFGFKNHEAFAALPIPKDIIYGLALEMWPEHSNYEYHLIHDCLELIEDHYLLFEDHDRTENELKEFLNYADRQFSIESLTFSIEKLKTLNNEDIKEIVKNMDIFKEIQEKVSHLETK